MSSDQGSASAYAHPVEAPRTVKPEPEPAPKKPKDTRTDGELRRDIERKRDELAQTLDALEYKLDVPARGREALETGKQQLAKQWDDNPLLVGGIALGALAAVAGAVLGIVALLRRAR